MCVPIWPCFSEGWQKEISHFCEEARFFPIVPSICVCFWCGCLFGLDVLRVDFHKLVPIFILFRWKFRFDCLNLCEYAFKVCFWVEIYCFVCIAVVFEADNFMIHDVVECSHVIAHHSYICRLNDIQKCAVFFPMEWNNCRLELFCIDIGWHLPWIWWSSNNRLPCTWLLLWVNCEMFFVLGVCILRCVFWVWFVCVLSRYNPWRNILSFYSWLL